MGRGARGRGIAALLAALTLGTGGAAAAGPAGDAPEIRVRSRARLELRVEEAGEGAVGDAVVARLLDAATDEGIVGRYVAIAVDGRASSRATEAGGRLRLLVPGPGRHRVEARFAGDEAYAPSEAVAVEVDASRRPVALSLRVPERVRLEEGVVPVSLLVEETGRPAAGLEVELRRDGVAAGRARTGRDGRASLSLPLGDAGAGALVRVEARFAGDAARAPAVATAGTTVITALALEAGLDEETVRAGAPIGVHGRLGDARGPLVGERVEVEAGERAAVARTDAAGRFSLQLPTETGARGPQVVRVRHVPIASWREAPPAVRLEALLVEARPIPLAPLVLVPLATALLLAARPSLRRLRAWAGRRRAGRRTVAADRLVASRAAALRAAGGAPRDERTVEGRAHDAAFDRPVADATVRIGDRATRTDERGRFRLVDVPADGRATLSVEAPGYLPVQRPVTLPHRGELFDLALPLEPVRARLLALHRATAAPLGGGDPSGTPRELADAALPSLPPDRRPALLALTRLVEEAYYAPRPAPPAALTDGEQLASTIAGDPPAAR